MNDRKSLGYLALKDKICGLIMVPTNDSVESKSKSKRIITVICLETLRIFSNVEPAEAKDNCGIEGFTVIAPISRPAQNSRKYFDSRSARKPNGGSPGGGGPNQDPNSGSAASSSSNKTPKAIPGVVNYGLGSRSKMKTKKEKALEKLKRELKESIKEEKKINALRRERGKGNITLIIKDGVRFFALNDQLRDKFHHATDLNSPIPKTLIDGELTRLANPSLHRERLQVFRNKKILPDAYVEQYGQSLRLHVLDPSTRVIEGTLGTHREARGGPPRIDRY